MVLKSNPNVIMMPKGYPSTTTEEYTAMRRGWTKVQGHWVPPSDFTQKDIAKILHAQQRRKVGEEVSQEEPSKRKIRKASS